MVLSVEPVLALLVERHIKIPQQLGKYHPHFSVRETVTGLAYRIHFGKTNSHFFPRQLRGPTWKGCRHSLRSPPNSASPINRSGMNSEARVKFASLWYIA